MADLVKQALAGNRLALARLLSAVENDTVEGRHALNELFPHTGKAHIIGVTGAPGTGKSTLVNRLAFAFRHPQEGQSIRKVAIIAVDPSSPFSGGAVLGDRVRMRDLAGDPGVFIRSMASRGSLGGLAHATASLTQVFDAAGYDIIIIETVGAGQAEVDIARLAHTTIVIEAPGLGDDIQAIKAGILEIADILVINKADRPGVENTERALKNMLSLAHPTRRELAHHGLNLVAPPPPEPELGTDDVWTPPIIRTIATEGKGVDELVNQLTNHREHLIQTKLLEQKERARLQNDLDLLLRDTLVERWRSSIDFQLYQNILNQLIARQISPWQAVEQLMDRGNP